ncbi:MAG: zinc-finger domain-containing protein [Rhodobacteraceae bacterium]|nr:zinc-finger domain-containing protein [Paracoccaceae bacterium]
MKTEKNMMEAPEIEYVGTSGVCCDGHGEHPRVWLTIPAQPGWVECGYCDKRFELKKD